MQLRLRSLYERSDFDRDRRRKRLSRKIRVQIGENQRSRGGARLRRASGAVRRDHDVLELQKLWKNRRYGRFALDDVQSRPCNALRLQRIDQRRRVHNRAAADPC